MMKKLLLASVAVVTLGFIAGTTKAAVVDLTFEGLQDMEPILNYYNGGLGGFGSGPGPNYGITFGGDSLAIISGAAGGSGNFSGSPSMPTVAFFLSGPGDVMNVPAGFTTGFSFYYSAVVFPGAVQVWSGLNDTGTLLASLALPVTPEGGSAECSYGAYCPWVPIGVDFSGTAESVNFTGTANYIGFDNVTLGSSTPVNQNSADVPEPATIALLVAGLAGIGLVRRRKAA
jgi:hypothetical protein